MLYVFDPLADRVFFIELSEIVTGIDLTAPVCSKKRGEAPKQTIDFDELMLKDTTIDLDENFYGDQDFDMDVIPSTTSIDSLTLMALIWGM